MQNEVTPFFYTTQDNEVKQVRTVSDADGEIWFCAKDVCEVLGIEDYHQAVETLDTDERGRYSLPTPSGNQDMTCVSEPGLYKLIFKSRKPEAKRFSRWVAHEVLPSIRRTGMYSMNEPKDSQEEKQPETKPMPLEKEKVLKRVKSARGIPQGIMKGAEKILSRTGLDDFQMTLALDEVFRRYTGVSVLEMAGIRAVADFDYSENRYDGTCEMKETWRWEHDYPRDRIRYGYLCGNSGDEDDIHPVFYDD